MDTIEWYEKVVCNASENAAAARAKINQRTLNRQLKAGRLSPETVAAIARAYGKDVLDALVISGLITRDDIEKHGIHAALEAATDREIADEVWKRLNDGEAHGAFDEPVAPTPTRPRLSVVADASEMSDLDGSVYDEQNVMAASEKNYDDEVEGRLNE